MGGILIRIDSSAAAAEERRRVSTISNMQATMHAELIELQRAKALSDAERVASFAGTAHRLELMMLAARALHKEAVDLAQAAANGEQR